MIPFLLKKKQKHKGKKKACILVFTHKTRVKDMVGHTQKYY